MTKSTNANHTVPPEPNSESVSGVTAPRPRQAQPLWVRALVIAGLIFCGARVVPLLLPVGPDIAGGTGQMPLSLTDWDIAMRELDKRQTASAAEYIMRSFGNDALQAQRAILQGRIYLDSGKLLAARQTLMEAMESSAYAPISQFWLGAVSYALGDSRSAEGFWLQAIQSMPNDPGVNRSLAMLYYDRGAIDRAVVHLKNVAAADATDARPLRLLGLIHKDYERYGEASEFYRQALQRGLVVETREQVRRELVECLLKTREYDAALKILDDTSMTYDAIALKAECLLGLGRVGEAEALLDDLLARDARHFPALIGRAAIHMEQRQYAPAIELLRRAIELKPSDYLAHFRLAQCLRSEGRADLAEAEAKRADEIKLMREQFSKLHQEANERPEDADVRFQLGQLAEKLDLPELAVVWYKSTLELKPDYAPATQAMQKYESRAALPSR